MGAPTQLDALIPHDLQIALTKGYDDIVFFAEQLLGMQLHEGQKKFLRNGTEKVNVLVPANRWGKSVTVAVKHIHHCFYKVGIGRGNTIAHSKAAYQTVNLSPHSDTTKPVFDAILQIMRSSFRITEADGGISSNKCLIEWFLNDKGVRTSTPYYIPFVNNSSILFRSTGEDQGKSIEGRSYGYISYDEGGQSNHLEYEVKRRILPRLGELDGSLDIVSTPEMSSPSILAHMRLFKQGGGDGNVRQKGFYSQEGSIAENIFFLRSNDHYEADMLAQYRGDPIVDQILYGKFVLAGDSLFATADVLDAATEELDKGIRHEPGHSYVIGIDTALGEDEMVYTVIDTTDIPYRLVRLVGAKGNAKSPDMHLNDLIDLFESYNKEYQCKIILETWNGESARFYMDLPPYIQALTKCFGSWQPPGITAKMTGRNPRNVRKAEILIALRKVLTNKEIKIPNNTELVEQLSIYREDDKKLKTDRVMSLALAVWLATDGKPKNETIEFQEIDW